MWVSIFEMKTPGKTRILLYMALPFSKMDIQTPLVGIFIEDLSRKGIYTTFITSSEKGVKNFYHVRKDQTNYYIIPNRFGRNSSKNVLSNALNFFLSARFVNRLLKSNQYSFFQIRGSIYMGFLALFFRWKYKVKVIFHYSFPLDVFLIESDRTVYRLSGSIFRQLLVYLLNQMHFILLDSVWIKKHLVMLGVKKEKIIALGMGVKQSSLSKIKKIMTSNIDTRPSNWKNRVTFIYIGKMSKLRKLDIILYALKDLKMKREDENFQVVFVGDGNDLKNLIQLSEMLELTDHTKFLGRVPQEDVLEFVMNSDVGLCLIPEIPIFILSSPTKLYEYLACGIPVIASRLPENIRVIRECQGGVVVGFSVKSISTVMDEIINGSISFPSRRKIHTYIAKRYSYKNHAKTMYHLYLK